jgi:2-dehydro-3-deoxygalactonokinase
MENSLEFISCDWGTSSFRLKWVKGGKVLREVRESVGSRELYERSISLGDASQGARAKVYSEFLTENFKLWAEPGQALWSPIPLVISGMASSSVGWKELPYAGVPFPLDGSRLNFEVLSWDKPFWLGETYLISGVASAIDMMRGEEVEAIGLMANPKLDEWRNNCVVVLPGTHSKHLLIHNNNIGEFHTYMTGELFHVLANHSLLRATVDSSRSGEPPDEQALAEFLQGVDWVATHGLPASLFRARTRGVLDHFTPGSNALFLSGVLIGAEFEKIAEKNSRVVIGGSGRLAEYYSAAFGHMANSNVEWMEMDPEELEHSVIAGQAMFLSGLKKQQ